MGEVGKFFLGGSTSKQKGQNQSSSESQNSSQNSSMQASSSGANNFQTSGSAGYNQAYGPISSAMTPALGYTTSAGNMMAALLGLPPSNFSYEQTPYAPGDSLMPAAPSVAPPAGPSLADLVKSLASAVPTSQTPAPSTGTPAPSTGGSAPTAQSPWEARQQERSNNRDLRMENIRVQHRERGGPVTAGQPYVVGEKRPELFVPNQSGTILPQVPQTMQTMQNTASPQGQRVAPVGGGGGGGFSGGGVGGVNSMLSSLFGDLESRFPQLAGRFDKWKGLPDPGTGTPGTGTPGTGTPGTGTPAPGAGNPASGLEDWSDSAGMNFILDQGQKAISGASAANGVFNSGATGKALQNYGQNIGKTYLNQYMQHLMSLGQLGLGAGSAMSNAGGVNQSQSVGGGSSFSNSAGLSQGSSQGFSNSQSSGTTSGSGSQKNGLLPALASFVPGAPG